MGRSVFLDLFTPFSSALKPQKKPRSFHAKQFILVQNCLPGLRGNAAQLG